MPILGYYHSFSFFGRSANVNAALPYAVGNFQGNVAGQPNQIYRSGLLDFTSRVSVNLRGGPAMPAQEFQEMEAKDITGRQPEGIGSYGPIRPNEAGELGHQPMGLQTGTWLLQALGQLDTRFVRRSVVLHDEPAVFFATNPQAANGKALSEALKAT